MYHFRINEAFIVHRSTYINVKWLTNGRMTNLMQNGTFTNRTKALNCCDIKFIVVHIIMTETIYIFNSIVCLVSCAIPPNVRIITYKQPMKIRLALLHLLSSDNSAITVGVSGMAETLNRFLVSIGKRQSQVHKQDTSDEVRREKNILPRCQVNR